MGLGYSLFVRPVLTLLAVVVLLAGVFLLPEFWPDYYLPAEAIRRSDHAALARYLARGLDPDERAQWRSFPRRLLSRGGGWSTGSSPDLGSAQESLLSFALGRCDHEAARLLIEAGASLQPLRPDGGTLLAQAALCGDAALVDAMVQRGAHPN